MLDSIRLRRETDVGIPAFILALLRACADAVIVGAGTLREEPKALWTAEEVVPEPASELASPHSAVGKPPHSSSS